MSKCVFVTATGTDVGKTYVSALIVKKLRDSGINCGYFKPALSGAEVHDGKLIPGDCQYVLTTAGIDEEPADVASYIFEPAVSPHLAAILENRPIQIEKITSDFARIKSKYDFVVVEGAGGIVCPFNLSDKKIMISDVIKSLGLDIIVVASASLGTINSTVLTVEYAKNLGINVRGIILNNYDETDLMQKDNLAQVEALTGVKVIAVVKNGDKELNIDNKVLTDVFKEIN